MPDKDKPKDADAVGYGKPPRQTRFKKGQSGNPAGRPKGALNLITILEETLDEQVIVNEGGQRRTMSKLQAAVKQLVNKAAAGDQRALQQLLGLKQLVDGRSSTPVMPEPGTTEEDRKVLEHIYHHFLMIQGGNDETSDAGTV